MSDPKVVSDEPPNEPPKPDVETEEARLRGAALQGAEQRAAVDHVEHEASRNPDTELRMEGEEDSLYTDGLDVEGDDEPLAGTDDVDPKGYKG